MHLASDNIHSYKDIGGRPVRFVPPLPGCHALQTAAIIPGCKAWSEGKYSGRKAPSTDKTTTVVRVGSVGGKELRERGPDAR
jgi:hypothetical protein